MTNLINIGCKQNDEFFRYKMPKIELKHETNKTIIVNIDNIAKSLHINPIYIMQFFGYELGTISKYNNKNSNLSYINGCHRLDNLSKVLNKFIEIFILCKQCKLPETEMKIKTEKIKITCKACGYSTKLYNEHKLIGYICKHN